jgi:hypothetical protein
MWLLLKRMEVTTQIDRLRIDDYSDLRSIIGLKKIVSLMNQDTVEIYEEDPADPGENHTNDESDGEEDDEEDDNEDDDNDDDIEDNDDTRS